jgi:DNA-binding MarR family transcriptional regulator
MTDTLREKLADHPTVLLIDILARSLADAIDAALAAAGFGDLNRSHGLIFETLEPGGSRVADMAKRARITKQGMGQLVAAVETLGYLQRTPDPADARAKLVTLTAKGERAVSAATAGLVAFEKALAEHLGAVPFDALRAGLLDLAWAFGQDNIR